MYIRLVSELPSEEPLPQEPPLELPPGLHPVVVLTPAIGGRGVAGGAQAEKHQQIISLMKGLFCKHCVDFTSITNNNGIKSLTCLFQIKALFENINQWVFSLVTESAQVVIHINSPHHDASEINLPQPINLQTARRSCC